MSGMRLNVKRVRYILLFHVVVLSIWPCMWCVDEDEYSQTGNDALLPNVTEQVFKKLMNITTILIRDIEENLEFCIKDEVADWNGAFNFTGNLDFLTSCIKNTNGQVGKRMCTAGEIKFFFNNLFEMGSAVDMTYLEPNMNCNLTSWVSGCEPGWGCAVGQNKKVDLQGSDVPYRTYDCRPCCEGFFCPVGMTCMLPCPLGSYCPLSTLNEETGICEPYSYQPPPGNPNHTCGGAEIWADVTSSWKVFCSPGSYCPATTKIVACSSGHYCRMGSTSEQRCFKLASCNLESTNQNIRAYGVILIVVLSVLMIVVLYFSEQLLVIREKRNSKTREAAAKHVRETVQARDRWKSAKDVAKKSTEQFSRTFSRRKSTRQQEQPEVSGQLKQNIGGVSSPSMPPDPSSASKQPSTLSKEKKKEPSKLAKILHAIQDDSNSYEGFDVANGDKNIKNKAPKGKHLHTHSQIFKYAYGQIEKEKEMELQNKNLTFSGVIAMATDGGEIKTRPVIEIDFEDLTLILKGKKKHILRCVTGKLRPGRVSAVMGPSGAGKTTFLSALAGKATGCTMSGSILINGKVESMHSYKKIIGFVPQDDIVHGNLTVEENLQFSARCRLSAEMPKPDKALVVERVIESLGLGAVRDSLVGTVEKRGISGGQRKRVNVGLEMVIEPSLLILDEPTTGLDSSSSQLLLRALRREALEGVNICMVVHQPSYALFKMFDDLVLLAKGGLTVYHGPVKKVEEYFSGLGINVPERVNPPDHFIDILEGIVKQDDSDMTHEQLPVKWMLHNGYPVPSDMLQYIDKAVSTSASASASSSASTKDDGTTIQLSFIRDLWWDIKFDCQLKREFIRHNFLKTKDLSHRITPGVVWQYRYFLGRVGKQRLREARTELIDFLILLIAGVCLGILAKVKDSSLGSSSYTFTVICVTLLSQVAALRSFSLDKVHYQRESASGISSLAHFLSKDTADLLNIAIKPLVFLSMFYFFNNPRSSFMANYIVLVCLVYCATGVAYAFAIVLDPSPSQLWSALLPVVFTLVANQDKDSAVIKYFGYFCYPRFALQALVIANAERYHGVWLITRCKALLANGYSLHDWNMCLMVLMLTGIMCRSLAFLFMVTFLKK